MTSTIKVNTIQNTCGADIIKESSNTITIGASGDTVTLASGASQSGFGRSGSVDWQTTAKTGDFTAANGEGYFVNTTSGEITATLPASPSVGDIVAFKDFSNTFDTNKLTIARNGSNIGGDAIDAEVSVEGQSLVLVYSSSAEGWLVTAAATDADLPRPSFVAATGGTITTVGDDKIHTFTGPGTFCVSGISATPANNVVSYLVVAGGGSGGQGDAYGGGGGAGGFREVKTPLSPYTASPLDGYGTPGNRISVTATAFPITVGAGGTGFSGPTPKRSGNCGSASVFSTISSAGGGGGGAYNSIDGSAGGSGGGSGNNSTPISDGGAGNTPPVSPPQGNKGGGMQPSSGAAVGGGGGATAVGGPGNPSGPSNGGAGATTGINNSSTTYAGGGGGGSNPPISNTGGSGGGGAGGHDSPNVSGTAGTANTGGGGGGNGPTGTGAGSGGSGIVIIRYKFQGS
tara:strand:- start:1035 stop:2408 length:1374 start_codon:yes stop_codon:yes gene_type:complete